MNIAWVLALCFRAFFNMLFFHCILTFLLLGHHWKFICGAREGLENSRKAERSVIELNELNWYFEAKKIFSCCSSAKLSFGNFTQYDCYCSHNVKIGGKKWKNENKSCTEFSKHRTNTQVIGVKHLLAFFLFATSFTKSWVTGSRWPCLSREIGPDVLQEAPSNLNCFVSLWFCD